MERKSIAVFSPHARVLAEIGRNPNVRMRDIAESLEMTERNVQNLMRDLQSAGLVEVGRRGRRNRYRLSSRKRVGHEMGVSMTVSRFLRLAGTAGSPDPASEPPAEPATPGVRTRTQAPAEFGPQRQIDWLSDS